MQDPQKIFCPNLECPARGHIGAGNIGIHSRQEKRYICRECGKTFAETKGTAFYRLRTAADLVSIVVTLLAHGCPAQAVVAAYGLDERTVSDWQARAGTQGQAVQEHWVERPRELGQVQADELRVKKQGGIVWMAMAMMVRTRLWLGGVVRPQRDRGLIRALVAKVRACAQPGAPLLFSADGLSTYVGAVQKAFRDPVATGRAGRPALRPWPGVCIVQMIKQYAQRRVVGVLRRVKQGTVEQVQALIKKSQGTGVINTAFIERLNGTFRSCLTALVRRGRALARQVGTLHQGMYLIGSVYNFCTPHTSLCLATGPHQGLERTPAMAAGITDHVWTVRELLSYRVPPLAWSPPKRRGRPSRALKLAIERWYNRAHD